MTLHGPSIPIQVHVAEPDPVRLPEPPPGAMPDSEPVAPPRDPAGELEPAPTWRRSR